MSDSALSWISGLSCLVCLRYAVTRILGQAVDVVCSKQPLGKDPRRHRPANHEGVFPGTAWRAVGAVAEAPRVSRKKPAKSIGKMDGRHPGGGEIMSMHDGRFLRLLSVLTFPLLSTACDGGTDGGTKVVDWPIAADVYTTAQQQILPVALSADTQPINPNEVTLYEQDRYSTWQVGVALPYEKRTELAPGYAGAPNAARLLSFFSVSDAHISDKESPAQPIYVGWSAPYGPSSYGLSAAYSPTMLSTTQVLDAAVQTINALHRESSFDFGLVLGDDINNSQYNELRWFIDVMDGQVITPSSGTHAGNGTRPHLRVFQSRAEPFPCASGFRTFSPAP